MLFPSQKKRLGTFGGVFTPSVLTILGVILFLRSGYIIGNGGLLEALGIIVLANSISFFTAYSLVAIATNLHIKGGGTYYIISRTLGPEWGAMIGIILFFAISVSVGFYCIGAAEVVAPMLYDLGEYSLQWTAGSIAVLLFTVAWIGADFSTKFQYFVMAVLALALLSFFFGALEKADTAQLMLSWHSDSTSPGFWFLFAVFFPAITGFTQGVNMSGDLKNPRRSIILGTIWAVGISFAIYIGTTLLLAAAYSQEILRNDMHAFEHAAWIPELVIAGIVAAAVSSALASFLGAPRVLSAMGKDKIFPLVGLFYESSSPDANPRRALILSAIIVALTIAVGELNTVASIVTIFFLLTYGVLNYATFYEAHAQSPSFRPTLPGFNKWVSFVGVLFCMGAIIAIDPAVGVISAFVVSLVYLLLKYKVSDDIAWSDSTRSFNLKRVRDLLLQIADKEEHPRDWHPNLVVFLPDRYGEWAEMLYFSSLIGSASGTITAVRFYEKRYNPSRLEEEEQRIKDAIDETGADAFSLVLSELSFEEGLSTFIQAYGLGPIKANTVILGWQRQHNDIQEHKSYIRRLLTALHLGMNLVILKTDNKALHALVNGTTPPKRIDIWWGESKTGQLMLLLAFLVTQKQKWEDIAIRILAQSSKDHEENTLYGFQQMLEKVRIDAEIKLLDEIHAEAIFEHSSDASFVFMPMKLFGTAPEDYVGDSLYDPRFDVLNFALFIAREDIELDADLDDMQNNETDESV
ncbi:MAG: amino acid permease [Sulfurimonadaceae bacterium]